MSDKDRTSELRKKGFAGRRLGPVQMTTDTAVRVTRMVVQDGSNRFPWYLIERLDEGRLTSTLYSAARKYPLHRPPRDANRRAREDGNAVSLRQGRRRDACDA